MGVTDQVTYSNSLNRSGLGHQFSRCDLDKEVRELVAATAWARSASRRPMESTTVREAELKSRRRRDPQCWSLERLRRSRGSLQRLLSGAHERPARGDVPESTAVPLARKVNVGRFQRADRAISRLDLVRRSEPRWAQSTDDQSFFLPINLPKIAPSMPWIARFADWPIVPGCSGHSALGMSSPSLKYSV